jgi:anti-sigma regulatory factor (Ser/Thr protein kinase)
MAAEGAEEPRSGGRRAAHSVAVYESDDDLLRRTLPFLREGLGDGDTVHVVASPPTAACLMAGLGRDARHVRWELPGMSYRSLGPMYGGLREHLGTRAAAGHRVRLLAESPTITDPGRAEAYLRFEAAGNDVLGAYGFPWACLYDRRRYPAALLAQVAQVHPNLLDAAGRVGASPAYLPVDTYLDAHPGPLSPVPQRVTLDVRLTAAVQLPRARRDATAAALALGLPDHDEDDFSLATAETLSNAVRHGERPCRLRLWGTPSHVVVRVDDRGPGDHLPTEGFRPPDPARGRLGGMGMWMIRQLADVVHVDKGPDGTTVEIQFHRAAASGRSGA